MQISNRHNNRGSLLMVSNFAAVGFILFGFIVAHYYSSEHNAHRGHVSGSTFAEVIFAASNIVKDNKQSYTTALASGPFELSLGDLKNANYLPSGFVSSTELKIIVSQSIYTAEPAIYLVKKGLSDHSYNDQNNFINGFNNVGGKYLYIRNGLAGSENPQVLNIIETALGVPLETGDFYTSSDTAIKYNTRALHRNSVPGKEYLNSMDTDLSIDLDLNNVAELDAKTIENTNQSTIEKLSVFDQLKVDGNSEFQDFNVSTKVTADRIETTSLTSSSLKSTGLIDAEGQTVTTISTNTDETKVTTSTATSLESEATTFTSVSTSRTTISPEIQISDEIEANDNFVSNDTFAIDAEISGSTIVTGNCSGC